jgi:chorismate dehydratase
MAEPIYTPPLNVGAVRYLNSRPLIEGVAELAPNIELRLDFPSRLADDLAAGELDCGLIPSIGCMLYPDYEVVSDACVATRGQVLSVKLYCRTPPQQVRRLALDLGSRTSATLVRILLAERFGVFPACEPLGMEKTTRDTSADAVLLIGDRAMHDPAESFHSVWDLGEEWTRATGLPFVFAVWATRAGVDLGGLDEALSAARDLGVSRLRAIAEREAPGLNISADDAYRYLKHNLHFTIGPGERAGLQRFHQLAVQYNLAPKGNDLVFRTCAAAG